MKQMNIRRVNNAISDPRLIMRDGGPRMGRFDRKRKMRDASSASPQRSGNRIGAASSLRQFGWIGPALSYMGNTARWAYSLNPDNDVVAAPTYPLEMLSTTPGSLLNACEIAVAGASGKTAASAVYAAAAVTLTLTANTTSAFGAFVRISNSTTNFKYGTYEVQICSNTTVLGSVWVQVASLPCELVILAIQNNAGKATIIGDTVPTVIFPYSATPGAIGNLNYGSLVAGDILYAETLNMRDIGNIVDAVGQGAILL